MKLAYSELGRLMLYWLDIQQQEAYLHHLQPSLSLQSCQVTQVRMVSVRNLNVVKHHQVRLL